MTVLCETKILQIRVVDQRFVQPPNKTRGIFLAQPASSETDSRQPTRQKDISVIAAQIGPRVVLEIISQPNQAN